MDKCEHEWTTSSIYPCTVCGDCYVKREDVLDQQLQQLRQQLQAAEQQNKQLQSDCAVCRDALERIAEEECSGCGGGESCSGMSGCDSAEIAKQALSTSSGKDVLENMRVMREAVGEIEREMNNPDNCNTPDRETSRLGRAINKAIKALVKVKGGA